MYACEHESDTEAEVEARGSSERRREQPGRRSSKTKKTKKILNKFGSFLRRIFSRRPKSRTGKKNKNKKKEDGSGIRTRENNKRGVIRYSHDDVSRARTTRASTSFENANLTKRASRDYYFAHSSSQINIAINSHSEHLHEREKRNSMSTFRFSRTCGGVSDVNTPRASGSDFRSIDFKDKELSWAAGVEVSRNQNGERELSCSFRHLHEPEWLVPTHVSSSSSAHNLNSQNAASPPLRTRISRNIRSKAAECMYGQPNACTAGATPPATVLALMMRERR